MKIAIVGSRTWKNEQAILECIKTLPADTIVVTGGAVGVDQYAEKYAKIYNLKVVVYYPDWKTFGNVAGMMRNQLIVDNSEMVVAFWDGQSKGTKSTIDKALKAAHIKQIIVFKE